MTVHGTWARKARWAQRDSEIAKAIQEWYVNRGSSAVVEPFGWSGRNSLAARRRAGEELAKHLDLIRIDNPEAAVYVIAHSHGGGVFAHMTRARPDAAAMVDGFIALATPWIGVTPRAYAAALREHLAKLLLFGFFIATMSTVPTLMWRALDIYVAPVFEQILENEEPGLSVEDQKERASIELYVLALVTGGFWYLASIAIASAGGLLILFPLHNLVSRHLKHAEHGFRARLEDLASSTTTPTDRLPASLFLKPIEDEAALALAWTSAMAVVMRVISSRLFITLQSIRTNWSRLPRYSRIIAGVGFTVVWSGVTMALAIPLRSESWIVLLLFSLVFLRDSPYFYFIFAAAVAVLVSWATVLLFAFTLLIVVLAGFMAAASAGMPSLSTALYLGVSVEAIPKGRHELVLVDVTTTAERGSHLTSAPLNHSALYDSPDAIRTVIDGLERFEISRNQQV